MNHEELEELQRLCDKAYRHAIQRLGDRILMSIACDPNSFEPAVDLDSFLFELPDAPIMVDGAKEEREDIP